MMPSASSIKTEYKKIRYILKSKIKTAGTTVYDIPKGLPFYA